MFKREVRITVDKTKKEDSTETPQVDDRFEEKANIVGQLFNAATHEVGKAVITYLVVDTIRNIVIDRVSK